MLILVVTVWPIEVRFSSDLTHLKDVRDEGYDKGKSELFNSLF